MDVAGDSQVERSVSGELDTEPYRHYVYTPCLTGSLAFATD
jgi:hypothetical protein